MNPEPPTSDEDVYVLAGQCLGGSAEHAGSAGSLCFELLLNKAAVDSTIETGAHLVTPGWLAHWREHVADWGFDREGAAEFFRESADRLALLDSGVYPDSARDIEEFADYVQRPWDRIPVGLDHLRLKLEGIVYRWRLQKAQRRADIAAAKAGREIADYAMTFDLLSSLGANLAEPVVAERVLDLMVTLFAPRRAIYLPFENGQAQEGDVQVSGDRPTSGDIDKLRVLPDEEDRAFPLQTEDGFALCLKSPGGILGVLSVEGIAFPQYKDHYLNLLTGIAPVFALALQTCRHVAQLTHAKAAIQREKEKYEGIVENLSLGVALVGPHMEILELNRQMRAWFPHVEPGAESLCYREFNRPPREAVCGYCPTAKTLVDGLVHEAVTETPADGSTIRFRVLSSPIRDVSGAVVAAIEIVEDVTQKLLVEQQLQQLQRAEAINTLARGMGHEINNPLNGIMNYAQIIKDRTEEGSDIGGFASEIVAESERIAVIVQHLRTLTGSTRPTRGGGDALDAVGMALRATKAAMDKDGVRVVCDLPSDVPSIPCASHEFGQLLVYLLDNARDALNERYPAPKSTKCITIRMAIRSADGRRFVRTTVEDGGKGIDEAHRQHIWDPFFTTRNRAHHAGLGLTLGQRTVHEVKGRLWYENVPQGGAQFHVELPLDAEKADQEEPSALYYEPMIGG